MTSQRGREGSGKAELAARAAAGFAVALIGSLVGLAIVGLGLIALMFAFGEPSSATPRLTAVGLAAIVLGVASAVGAVGVGAEIAGTRS